MREEYMRDVADWAMFMLTVMRKLPNSPEKLTLLQQVSRLKDGDITVSELPAYSGAIAVLSDKASLMLNGQKPGIIYHKDHVLKLLRSKVLKVLLLRKAGQFSLLGNWRRGWRGERRA